MTNILKAFMLDLREEGFGYAVKRMACRINPYAQLREAREWVGDQREIIEALAQDVVQLERDYAALRAEKEESVILTGNRPEDGESEWQRITQNQIESAEHWLEFQRAVADARPYSDPTKKEEPVILTGNRPEDGASQTLGALVSQGMPWDAVVMLDEWVDPDLRKKAKKAGKKLHPLLFKKNTKKR
jgi:hypothetical protein